MRVSIFYSILLFGSIQLLMARSGYSQGLNDIAVTVEMDHENLENLFAKIEKQSDLKFIYAQYAVKYNGISMPRARRSVSETLDLALDGKPLRYRQTNGNVVIFREEEDEKQEENEPYISITPGITVRGKVTETDGSPLPGANIVEKGTANGTVSDADGNYLITVDDDAVLVFSFIGRKKAELPVNGKKTIDVALKEDIGALNEVVVNAGYYDVTKAEMTGNISRIDAEVIEKQPVSNPLEILQGRTPGIYLDQYTGIPGGDFKVRIRGTNSLANGNDPLYIIDGTPFISESLSDPDVGGVLYNSRSGISPLNSIDPNDIASIEILKDADATAIYGSRGANGVVLITTKKGKPGEVKVDLNVKSGISKVAQRVDLMNAEQYVAMRLEAFENDGIEPSPTSDHDINGSWDYGRDVDWQEELLGGSAEMTNINATISGGSQETQFLLSTSFQNQTTVFPGDHSAKRYSALFSVSHDSPDKKFSTNLSSKYVVNLSDLVAKDFTSDALRLPPNAPPLYDSLGNLLWGYSTNYYNPLGPLENRYDGQTKNLLLNLMLGYHILKALGLKINIGLNDIRNDENRTDSSDAAQNQNSTPTSSRLIIGQNTSQSWIFEPQLNWAIQIGKGTLTSLVGGTYQYRTNESSRNSYKGFSSNALINNPKAAAEDQLVTYNYSEYKYAALYGRINFNWDEKYFLNLTGRRDGSSRFGPGNKFANFGAVGAAWIFSNEELFKNSSFFSFGKLRGSYGHTGNDQIGDYRYLDTYRSGNQYNGISILNPSGLFNPDYRWEVNRKLEGAIDLGFINDRIFLSVAYFRNRSSNQLIAYQLASTTGNASVLRNFPAIVQNTGVELELTTRNIDSDAFEWTTSINVTVNRNKLVSFPGIESSSYANTYIVGQPLSITRVHHYLGVDPKTGYFQFKDYNNDGLLTAEDRQKIRKNDQGYYGGFLNSISYKSLQIDILFQFVNQEGSAFSANYYPGRLYWNQPVQVLDGRWQEPGDEAIRQKFSKTTEAGDAYGRYISSDANIQNTSFIRLKNVAVSYRLPDDLLGAINARVYAQGQNLVTITNYSGLDPETGLSSLPPLTTFVGGIQLIF